MKIQNPELLALFATRNVCEFCGFTDLHGGVRKIIETHHVWCRGLGGASRIDRPWSLIRLCNHFGNNCHGRAQEYKISRRQILEIVARRVKSTPEAIEAEYYCVLRLPKGSVYEDSICP